MPTIDRSQRVRLPNVPNAVPTGSRARAGLRTWTRRPGPTVAERQARTRAERGSVGKRGTYVRSKLKAVRRARDAMRSRGRSISAAPFGTRTRRARHARGRGGRTPRVLNSMYERNVCARCRLTTCFRSSRSGLACFARFVIRNPGVPQSLLDSAKWTSMQGWVRGCQVDKYMRS